MTNTTPCVAQSEIETTGELFDNWFDPIEAGLRDRTREFLQAMFEAELEEVLARSRYSRRAKSPSGDSKDAAAVTGHRHGHRSRSLLGTFGKVEIAVPRARLCAQAFDVPSPIHFSRDRQLVSSALYFQRLNGMFVQWGRDVCNIPAFSL
jgi:hypothetical protein